MMKKLIAFALLLLSLTANAQQAVIWKGTYAKVLPTSGLLIGGDDKGIVSLAVDPTAGAGVASSVGSVGLFNDGGVGKFYLKTGAANTAWSQVTPGGAPTGTANTVAYFDSLGALSSSTDFSYNASTDLVGTNGFVHTAKATELGTTNFTLLEGGTDSVVWYDGTPMGFYWNNPDSGSGRLEFRTRGGTGLNLFASQLSSNLFSGGAFNGSTATLSSLTQNHIVFAGAGGLLTGDANLNWNNTSKLFGLGTSFLANNRAVIRGLGTTSGTNSLLIEDSAGIDMLTLRDDKLLSLVGRQTITNTDGANYAMEITHSGGTVTRPGLRVTTSGTSLNTTAFTVTTGTGANAFTVDGASTSAFGTSPQSNNRLVVRGTGTTSSTNSLLVEDSAGTDVFTVRDDSRAAVATTISGTARLNVFDSNSATTGSPTALTVSQSHTAGNTSGFPSAFSTTVNATSTTNPISFMQAFNVQGRTDNQSADITFFQGADLSARHTRAGTLNITTLQALNAYAQVESASGAGTITNLRGAQIGTSFTSGNTVNVTTTEALRVYAGNAGGTVTTHRGVSIETPSSGTITTNETLRVAPPTVGTNRYALHFPSSLTTAANGISWNSGDTNFHRAGAGVVQITGTTPTLQIAGSSSGFVGLRGAAAAGGTTFTLPAADGTNGQMIVTNGSGTLSFADGARMIIFGSRGTPRNIVAATGIVSGSSHMSTTALRQKIYVQGSGGAVTVTANPQIQAGTIDGQDMVICGRSNTNTVTLSNGTGLVLNGSAVLGEDDCISLNWDTSSWVELSRNF